MNHYERIKQLEHMIEKYNEQRANEGHRCKDIFESIEGLRKFTTITDEEIETLCILND